MIDKLEDDHLHYKTMLKFIGLCKMSNLCLSDPLKKKIV